jgi:hypothetical protein
MQTENRIYGLDDSASATGTHLALQSFLTASTEWQKRCLVFPGGTNLPYFEVTADAYKAITIAAGVEAKRAAAEAAIPSQETLDRIAQVVVDKLNISEDSIADKVAKRMRQDEHALLLMHMPKIQIMIEQSVVSALGKAIHIVSMCHSLLLSPDNGQGTSRRNTIRRKPSHTVHRLHRELDGTTSRTTISSSSTACAPCEDEVSRSTNRETLDGGRRNRFSEMSRPHCSPGALPDPG